MRGAGFPETTNWISILMREIGKFVKPKVCSGLARVSRRLALMNSPLPRGVRCSCRRINYAANCGSWTHVHTSLPLPLFNLCISWPVSADSVSYLLVRVWPATCSRGILLLSCFLLSFSFRQRGAKKMPGLLCYLMIRIFGTFVIFEETTLAKFNAV